MLEKKGSYSYAGNFVRTSRSEDFLQNPSVATVNIEIEEDITTSLNNLLGTDKDSTPSDRVVWTCNAPVSATGSSLPSADENPEYMTRTSIADERTGQFIHIPSLPSDQNTDEILVNGNNISNMITSNRQRYAARSIQSKQDGVTNIMIDENKIYVRVLPEQTLPEEKIPANKVQPVNNIEHLSKNMKNVENREEMQSEAPLSESSTRRCNSPEDESDVESLNSFHYSPKAIDMPSASRLAKRLYNLEGFKKSDVSRHLCKK